MSELDDYIYTAQYFCFKCKNYWYLIYDKILTDKQKQKWMKEVLEHKCKKENNS